MVLGFEHRALLVLGSTLLPSPLRHLDFIGKVKLEKKYAKESRQLKPHIFAPLKPKSREKTIEMTEDETSTNSPTTKKTMALRTQPSSRPN